MQPPDPGDLAPLDSVPRVDLADFRSADPTRRGRFSRDVRTALTQFGFVRVAGHGIDDALIRRAYAMYERFFSSSQDAKNRCASEPGGQRGYTAFGVEHAKDEKDPDPKEFFHVGRELELDHPLRERYPANIWPEDIPEFRAVNLALYERLDVCAAVLLESLALAFDLPRETFSSMLRDGNSILRALHYPPCEPPRAEPSGAVRAAPHEDINLITLLCEATDAGLEIVTRDGTWLAVPAHPGEIVADAGDMLSRITNGVVPATTHRVVARSETRDRHRYSLPFFAHPYPDCDLSVIAEFIGADEGAKYPPITAGEFLNERLREIGLID